MANTICCWCTANCVRNSFSPCQMTRTLAFWANVYMAYLYLCTQILFSLCFRFVFEMFTVYELLEVVGSDLKRKKWMQKYNMTSDCSVCPACGGPMAPDTHRGKQGMRCTNTACRKRVSSVSGGLLEGSHHLFPVKRCLLFCF